MLKPKNIFDLAYARNPAISWRQDEEGLVELTVENKGFFNRLAQKVFNRPAISYIQLDAIGSLVWLQLGQKDDVLSISEAVKEKFPTFSDFREKVRNPPAISLAWGNFA